MFGVTMKVDMSMRHMVFKFRYILSEMKSSKTLLYICTHVSYLVTLHLQPPYIRIPPRLYTHLNDVNASRVGDVVIPTSCSCEIVENTLQVYRGRHICNESPRMYNIEGRMDIGNRLVDFHKPRGQESQK